MEKCEGSLGTLESFANDSLHDCVTVQLWAEHDNYPFSSKTCTFDVQGRNNQHVSRPECRYQETERQLEGDETEPAKVEQKKLIYLPSRADPDVSGHDNHLPLSRRRNSMKKHQVKPGRRNSCCATRVTHSAYWIIWWCSPMMNSIRGNLRTD